MTHRDEIDDLEPEVAFLAHLDDLDVVLWVGTDPHGCGYDGPECSRPLGWQNLTHEENLSRLARFHFDYAPFICANTGILAVFDSDTKNGGDPEEVRALLDRLGERIYAEIITPSGGRHYYVEGHRDLPTVHSKADNPKLPDFPGLDIQSHGCNVFAPGTLRPKYGMTGYTVVVNELDQMPTAVRDEPTPLTDWVAEQLAPGVKTKARKTPAGAREWTWDPCEPWNGDPPDARQSKYLHAACTGEADKVAKTTKGGRNDALHVAALKLGSYVAGAGLDEEVVIAALEAAAETNGLTAEDGVQSVRATIRSGLRGGKRNPRAVPEPTTQEGSYENDVADELMKLRIRAEAKRLYEQERSGPTPPFDSGLLCEILARPEEPRFRIHELAPANGGLLVVAQRKTGKTTLLLNLARSLLTAEPFLSRFSVVPVAGRVAFLNYEVSGAQLARWADDVGVPHDRLLLVNLRGRRNPLVHAQDRGQLAELLVSAEVESVIVDPFGRAYTGKSQNDSGDVAAWLTDLDVFVRSEVGARDVILSAHAGWVAERSRGSSALEDWADSTLTMTKSDDGGRYLSALGRDVSLDEDRLDFDQQTRLLSLTGAGSRRDAEQGAKSSLLVNVVIGIVTGEPGLNVTQIVKRARELQREGSVSVSFQDKALREAVTEAVQKGAIRREGSGEGSPFLHFPVDRVQEDSDGPPLDAVPS